MAFATLENAERLTHTGTAPGHVNSRRVGPNLVSLREAPDSTPSRPKFEVSSLAGCLPRNAGGRKDDRPNRAGWWHVSIECIDIHGLSNFDHFAYRELWCTKREKLAGPRAAPRTGGTSGVRTPTTSFPMANLQRPLRGLPAAKLQRPLRGLTLHPPSLHPLARSHHLCVILAQAL